MKLYIKSIKIKNRAEKKSLNTKNYFSFKCIKKLYIHHFNLEDIKKYKKNLLQPLVAYILGEAVPSGFVVHQGNVIPLRIFQFFDWLNSKLLPWSTPIPDLL